MKDNSIIKAFEIEHSTSVYSGLLRMSDLNALVPNLSIDFYIVAPGDRSEKVIKEIEGLLLENYLETDVILLHMNLYIL